MTIFGDGGVGKTSLTKRYMEGMFIEDTKLTIGTAVYKKELTIEGKNVTIQIWDVGGEEQFRALFPTYFSGSFGAIFMYDITRFSSIKNLADWMEKVKQTLEYNQTIPMYIVGGKLDLEHKRSIERANAEELAQQYGFMKHIECSAKTGENVEDIFYSLTYEIMRSKDVL